MQQIIQRGTHAISISSNDASGPFRANVYVNCQPNLRGPEVLGDITPVGRGFSTLKGALTWANGYLTRMDS